MAPTTSRPRPKGERPAGAPLRAIRVELNLEGGAVSASAARGAGITVARRGSGVSLKFSASTEDEALERLRAASDLASGR